MKLTVLFEQKSIEDLRSEISILYGQKNKLLSFARVTDQNPIVYKQQLDRIEHKIAVLRQQISSQRDMERNKSHIESDKIEFYNHSRSLNDDEVKLVKRHDAKSDSMKDAWNNKKKANFIKYVARYLENSISGKRPDLEKAADHFKRTPRTISLWLEPGHKVYEFVIQSTDYPLLRQYLYNKH